MSGPQPVTETCILRPKPGIDLETAPVENWAVQEWSKLLNILKSQKGMLRQYWGHQVEDRSYFIYCVDWESSGHHTSFMESQLYPSFLAGISTIFETQTERPIITHTCFTSDWRKAFESPVTEIAFFTLPSGYGHDVKKTIEEVMKPNMETAVAVGKAHGTVIGWVSEVAPQPIVSDDRSVALHIVFGYASLEDHFKWSETPEHAQVIKVMIDLAKTTGLDSFQGGGRPMYHVKFRAA